MGMHGWPIYILSSLVHCMYFIACMCVRLLLYHVLLSALLLCLYLCVCVCVCLMLLSLSFIIVFECLLFNVDLLFRPSMPVPTISNRVLHLFYKMTSAVLNYLYVLYVLSTYFMHILCMYMGPGLL